MCSVPISSCSRKQMVPSCKQGPVPFVVMRLLFICQRVPGMNFWMSLHMCPVVKLPQTKKIKSASKWVWVFSWTDSMSAHDVVKLCSEQCDGSLAPLETPKMAVVSPLFIALFAPLEVPSIAPSEAPKMAPSEVCIIDWFRTRHNWWHAIADRTVRISNVERGTRNEDMMPHGGTVGRCKLSLLLETSVICGKQREILLFLRPCLWLRLLKMVHHWFCWYSLDGFDRMRTCIILNHSFK